MEELHHVHLFFENQASREWQGKSLKGKDIDSNPLRYTKTQSPRSRLNPSVVSEVPKLCVQTPMVSVPVNSEVRSDVQHANEGHASERLKRAC